MMPQMASKDVAELARELRIVMDRIAADLRMSIAKYGLTPTRLSALAALAKWGPQRPGTLAARLGMSQASMSHLSEILEASGWVVRRLDPEDGRAYLLSVTDDGVSVLNTLQREGTARLTDGIRILSDRQRQVLSDALPILNALADHGSDQSDWSREGSLV